MAMSDICLLNVFKTYEEAEEHRLKLKDPEYFGMLSMNAKDGTALYAPVLISLLKQFME